MVEEIGVSTPADSRTFEEWLDARPDLAAGSRQEYARAIRMFKRSRDEVSVEGLGNFLDKHKQRHVKAALLLYCKFLVKPDIAAELREMKIKYRKGKERELPDLDDIFTVVDACEPETRYMALFLLYTGCRCQEALTVLLKDLEKGGQVTVRDIKNVDKYRTIYLPDDFFGSLMDYLTNIKGIHANQRIFYTDCPGTPLTHLKDFYHKLNEVAQKKIGRGLQTHDFRRTCATILYKRTHDIEYVRRILGHSSISTTHRYTKYAVRPQDLKKSKQILSGLRSQQNTKEGAPA